MRSPWSWTATRPRTGGVEARPCVSPWMAARSPPSPARAWLPHCSPPASAPSVDRAGAGAMRAVLRHGRLVRAARPTGRGPERARVHDPGSRGDAGRDAATVRTESFDLVVVGAGPAGMSAAIEAARTGASVALVDENPSPGGNIYRQPPKEFVTPIPATGDRGSALRRDLDALPVRRLPETTVWGAFRPHVLEVVRGEEAFALEGRAVIVATGAYDRPFPVPGWTLPGVLTVGGAQTLLKGQGQPGRRFLRGDRSAAARGRGSIREADIRRARRTEAPGRQIPGPVGSRAAARRLRYRLSLIRRRIPWVSLSVLVRGGGPRWSPLDRRRLARRCGRGASGASR